MGKLGDITRLRLYNQQISHARLEKPADVVSWMLAMQAQDFAGSKWSIALRLPGCRETDIDKAITDRSIVRTWPMRGTLHLLAAVDVRWMVKLLAPRIISRAAGRHRQLELTEKTFDKSLDILTREMEGGKILTRTELYALLEKNHINTDGQRGIHIIGQLAQKCVLCHGPHRDKQPTYVLLDDWLPPTPDKSSDEALAELALRYFTSHGPATVQDLIWWAGLTVKEAKAGLGAVSEKLEKIEMNGDVYWTGPLPRESPKSALYLLPGFDEYMLGYTDRSLIVPQEKSQVIVPGNNGMFMPTIILNGQVTGTWKRTLKKDRVMMEAIPFEPLSAAKMKAFEVAARKYARYLGIKSTIIDARQVSH